MDSRSDLLEIIREECCQRRAPVTLSDGSITEYYLDLKGVLCDGYLQQMAAYAMAEHLFELGVFTPCLTAIGGPTMGADVISHSFTMTYLSRKWFSVREPKTSHGLGKIIEGATLGPGDKVIITDDTANTGASLLQACGAVQDTGAEVLVVAPLVDRGNTAAGFFEFTGIPYRPMFTYEDLGIEPL